MLANIIEQVALVTGKILHGGTGLPVAGQVTVTALEGVVYSRVFKDGVFVVSGKLAQLFPLLSAQPYNLTLQIRADSPQFSAGYAEQVQSITIPQAFSFEAPISLPVTDSTLYFPADPVNIRGGVVEAAQPENPIPTATVEVLQAGAVIATTATNSGDRYIDSEGRYRLNNVVLTAPSVIRCRALGFTDIERSLLVDFSRFINREDFRLPTSS